MSHFTIIAAVVVWVIASARIVRLLAFDSYPPAARLRVAWDNKVTSDWNKLLHCGYCLAPWVCLITGVLALWALPVHVHFGNPQTWFWLAGGWLAGSYAAAIAVAYDGDD